jgi:phosphatidylglycerol:prolipoprotein diacylglycerol transferase
MIQLALFAYFVLFLILLKTRSIKPAKIWFVPLFSIYVGLILATLLAIFLNGADSSLSEQDSFFSILIDVMNPVNGRGKVLYGGYFGLIVGYLILNFVTRRKSLPLFLDISAICTSLLFAIWRINCFLSGCCFGMPTKILGISFPNSSHAFRYLEGTDLVVGKATVPLLPTQLISSFGDFAIFLFLLILFLKRKTTYPYFYLFAHAILYGIGRFTIEFFRIDPREFWGPLSMSQWISLMLVAAGLVFFIKNRKEIVESFKNSPRNS